MNAEDSRPPGGKGVCDMSLTALLKKYKELILYCVFGFLTFLVSVLSYALCVRVLGLNELVANVISWVLAVLFAFFTNRKWVFDAGDTSKGLLGQMASFFGGRLFTLAVEELILLVFVTWLRFDGVAVKIVAQVVVIVLNYFISKLWVFKKDTASN